MSLSLHHYDLPAPIWQVAPHTTDKRFALLLRKQTKAAFLTVAPGNAPLTPLVPLNEDAGSLELVGYADDVLLFHRYDRQSSLPEEPLALLAYDTAGTLRWEADFARLLNLKTSQVQVERNWQGRQFGQVLDVKTGIEVAENSYIQEIAERPLQLPQLYRSDSPYFQDFVTLFSDFGLQPERGVEYLEWKNYMVISFYVRQKKQLRNELWIINDQKELLLQKTIASERNGIGKGTFWQFYESLFAPDATHGLLEIK